MVVFVVALLVCRLGLLGVCWLRGLLWCDCCLCLFGWLWFCDLLPFVTICCLRLICCDFVIGFV